MGRLTKSAAILAGAVLVAWGGAFALASSTGHTITVCVSHKGGALYKAKRCAKHDKKLSWNQQGPQGATGAQGLQGLQGTAGTPGTLNAYEAYRTISAQANIGKSPTTLITLDVPAGAYSITAYGELDNHTDNTSIGQVSCSLVAGSDTNSSYSWFNGGTDGQPLPLSVTHTFTNPGTVLLQCQKQFNGAAYFENGDVVATQVASTTRTQVTG